MKMIFIGATHEVTGSCTYLEVCGKHILVDFGMEQGRDTYENVKIPCAPSQIDYVLLTHAHIDHSGLLPLERKASTTSRRLIALARFWPSVSRSRSFSVSSAISARSCWLSWSRSSF